MGHLYPLPEHLPIGMQNYDREDALKVTELTEQVTFCYTLSPRWCVLRLAAGTGLPSHWRLVPVVSAPVLRCPHAGTSPGPRTHPLPCCLHLLLASIKLITNVLIEIIGGNKCAIIIVKVRFLFKRSGLIISTECPLSTVHGV